MERIRGAESHPRRNIDKLNKEINAALADPKIEARIGDLGSKPFPGSPADFGELLANETEKWGKLIRAANIKPE
jgi:tripartite-type tricarboxylate transporter receptor subunit TctC